VRASLPLMGVSPFAKVWVFIFVSKPRYTRSLRFYTTTLTPPFVFYSICFLDTSLSPGSKWGMLAPIEKALKASACDLVRNVYG